MSRGKSAHIGDDDLHDVFPISKLYFITFQDRIDQKFDAIKSHSRPPRDQVIRCPQKVTHIESSSDTQCSSSSTNFHMKIDLPCFNGHLKIEEFLDWLYQNYKEGNRSIFDYTEKFYRLCSRIDLTEFESYMISRFKGALQSFFNLHNIVMGLEHIETLLEKEKTRIQTFRS
ncbi:unnamed protein product [Spirodela intermedia]|uniref:Uncharacterized protein n=1 Tax=Spirodela intermedia TaxID=51605 RepID=A0A7I8L804_SPIIN|nr:unnamed protein product [Spirodela intermedia]